MTDLLKEGLRNSEPEDEKRSIARARTLTVFRQLDGDRKGLLLLFLHESGLIGESTEGEELRKEAIVELIGANLIGANLSFTNLAGADLTLANLAESNLSGANLLKANLYGANLSGSLLVRANMNQAILAGADLSFANLTEAIIFDEQLAQALTLEETRMPDGTLHE